MIRIGKGKKASAAILQAEKAGNLTLQSCENSVLPKDAMGHTPYRVSVLTWTEEWANKKDHFSGHPQNQNQINKWPAFAHGNSHTLGWIILSELKSWIINRIFRSLAVSCLNCSNYLLLWLHIHTPQLILIFLNYAPFLLITRQWFPEVLPNTLKLWIKAYNTASSLALSLICFVSFF